MKGALNNIIAYRLSPTKQENLYTTFLNMKTNNYEPIPTWSGDKPLELIYLHEGLVSPGAIDNIATLNGHTLASFREAKAAPADELKESIDK